MVVDEVITVGMDLRVAMLPHCFQSLQVLCWHNCMSTMPPHCAHPPLTAAKLRRSLRGQAQRDGWG